MAASCAWTDFVKCIYFCTCSTNTILVITYRFQLFTYVKELQNQVATEWPQWQMLYKSCFNQNVAPATPGMFKNIDDWMEIWHLCLSNMRSVAVPSGFMLSSVAIFISSHKWKIQSVFRFQLPAFLLPLLHAFLICNLILKNCVLETPIVILTLVSECSFEWGWSAESHFVGNI